jgi:hypothetical protein
MNFAGVYGMAAHPTEDYLLIADSHITGGIYKIYTKDTTTDECSPAKNNNKWQTCESRYGCGDMRETVTALNDRSNTCYKYDTKHVTVYPNRAHPTDPYNGRVDGIAIAPNGKYAVLSSSGGQYGSWIRTLDLETNGMSDFIGAAGGNGGRDYRADGTLAIRAYCQNVWPSSNFSPRYAPDGSAVLSNPVSMSVGASPSPVRRAPLHRKSAMTRRAVRMSAVHSQRQEPDYQRQGSRWERRTSAHRRDRIGAGAHVHHRVWRPR